MPPYCSFADYQMADVPEALVKAKEKQVEDNQKAAADTTGADAMAGAALAT